MKTTSKSRIRIPSPPPLQNGQMWELKDSNLQIDLVGKRLVHYKHFKGKTKRAPISITGIKVLEKYLEDNEAVLMP